MTGYRSNDGLQELLQEAMGVGKSSGLGSGMGIKSKTTSSDSLPSRMDGLSLEGRRVNQLSPIASVAPIAIARPSSTSPPAMMAGLEPSPGSSYLSSILPLRPRSSLGSGGVVGPNNRGSVSNIEVGPEQKGSSFCSDVIEAMAQSTTIAQLRTAERIGEYGHMISVSPFGIAYVLSGGKKVRLIAQRDGAKGMIEFSPEEQALLPIVDIAWYNPQSDNNDGSLASSHFHWMAILSRGGEIRVQQVYAESRQILTAKPVLAIVFPELSPSRGLTWGEHSYYGYSSSSPPPTSSSSAQKQQQQPLLAVWGEGPDVAILSFSLESSTSSLTLTHKLFITTAISDIVEVKFDPDGCSLAVLGRDGSVEVYAGGVGGGSFQHQNQVTRLISVPSREPTSPLKTWLHRHRREELILVSLLEDRQTLSISSIVARASPIGSGGRTYVTLPTPLPSKEDDNDWLCLMDEWQGRDTLVIGSKEAVQPLYLINVQQLSCPKMAVCPLWNIDSNSMAILDACCCSQVPQPIEASDLSNSNRESGIFLYSFHDGIVKMTQIEIKDTPTWWTSTMPLGSSSSRTIQQDDKDENKSLGRKAELMDKHGIEIEEETAATIKKPTPLSANNMAKSPSRKSSIRPENMASASPLQTDNRMVDFEKIITGACQQYLEKEFVPRMEAMMRQISNDFASAVNNCIQEAFATIADQMASIRVNVEEVRDHTLGLGHELTKSLHDQIARIASETPIMMMPDTANAEPAVDLAYFERLVGEGHGVQALGEVLELGDLELLDQLMVLIGPTPPSINQLSPQVIISLIQQLSLDLTGQVGPTLNRKLDWLTALFMDMEPGEHLYGGGGDHSLRETAETVLKGLLEALRTVQRQFAINSMTTEIADVQRRLKVLISLVRSALSTPTI